MQLKTLKASQRGLQALSFPKPSTMPQTHAGTGNWEWCQKMFFPTRHKAKQHQRLSTIPDSASATAQGLGKERGHSGLLRNGNKRLRSHERRGEYGCLFIILLYHVYYLALRPSLASLLLTQADSTINVAQWWESRWGKATAASQRLGLLYKIQGR